MCNSFVNLTKIIWNQLRASSLDEIVQGRQEIPKMLPCYELIDITKIDYAPACSLGKDT